MDTYLGQRGQDAFGRHRYDPHDFGWSYPGLAEEFSDYTKHYGVASEHGDAGVGQDG
jgi:hypothetical protein